MKKPEEFRDSKETSTKIRLSDEAKKEIEFCLYDWMAEMHMLGKKHGEIIDYCIYVNYEIDEEELDT
tara:strand:+ start:279 stop:479 length:201 start_codon:yes stop_codon:yes gene_type:complete